MASMNLQIPRTVGGQSPSGTLKFPPLMRRGILALFLIAPWAMRDTLARFVNQRSIISEIFLMCVDILMQSPQRNWCMHL